MSKEEAAEVLPIDGREVRVTHPDKPYFSRQTKLSKLDLVRYYLSVAPGALAGIRDRPMVLKRFVNGAEGEAFYQKRAPAERPAWLRTTTLSFPSGRTAEEMVVDDAAGLAWIVNLGCIELHPHPVRSGDLDHPDELRVDLDPGPGVSWADVRRVALEVKALLEEMGLRGWPKTSGSRGMHVNVRIEPRWTFSEVRRAALALVARGRAARARAGQFEMVERRAARRVSRLQPEREGSDDVLGVFRAPAAGCARVDAASTGARSPTASRPTSPCSRFRSVSRSSAIRTQDGCCAGFARKIARTRGERRGRGSRRRALAAALSQDGGRSAAGCSFARQVPG